jgi:CHAT domain-containing protein
MRQALVLLGAGALLFVADHFATSAPVVAHRDAPTGAPSGGHLDHFSSDPLLERLDRLVAEDRYLEAFTESVAALGQRARRLGPEDRETLESLQWTGAIAMLGGDRRSAGEIFDALVAIRGRTLAADDPVLAETLLDRGRVARSLADDGLAARCIAEARRVLQASDRGARLWPSLVQAEANVARRTDLEAARRGYLDALTLRRLGPSTDRAEIADNLTWLAWTLDRLGRPDEAFAYVEEARRHLRGLGLVGGSLDATLRQLQVDDLVARGRWNAAEAIETATAETNVARRKGCLGGFARRICPPDGFETLALAALRRGEWDRAWALLERGRAAMHRDFAAFGLWRTRAPDSFREARLLRGEIARLTRHLEAVRRAPRETAWSADTWILTLRALEDRARLAGLEARYLEAFDKATPSRQAVQALLPPRTALLGWLEVDVGGAPAGVSRPRRSWGFLYVLRRTGPVHWVPIWDGAVPPGLVIPRSEWGGAFARVRRAAEWPLRVEDDPTLPDQLRDWARRYFDPALPFLAGIDHLVVEGTLLPVELLRDAEGRFLVDRYDISYTPSAAFLALLAERPRRQAASAPRSILALTASAPSVGTDPSDETRALRQSRTSFARRQITLDRLPRLPFAAAEAQDVARRFPIATVLDGGPGVETGVRRLAESGRLGDYDVIHVAGHMLVDGSPERCGLALAEREPGTGSEDDGVLDAEEVFLGWDVKARLLTLSACESARAAGITRGEDLGFSPVLFAAGAERVLLSLWPVDDRATKILMDRFYEDLLGAYRGERLGRTGTPLPPASALREAKTYLRGWSDAAGRHPYRHPAYWGGFVLVGRVP